MQSMHVLPRGVGYTYDMVLEVRRSRGKRELALVSIGWETGYRSIQPEQPPPAIKNPP